MANEQENTAEGNPLDFLDSPEVLTFPVDMTREEYIAFNMLVAKTMGILRHRKGQSLLFAVLLSLCLGMMMVSRLVFHYVDMISLLLFLLVLGVGLLLLFGLPGYLRRTAARAYDRTIQGGYDFYGIVRVLADRMEKESKSKGICSAIYYAKNAVYIESKDMMILLAPGSRAIVLPARCMTEKDAELVRRRVTDGVDAVRQRLLHKMTPLAGCRIHVQEDGFPSLTREEEKVIAVSVQYRPKEYVELATDKAGRKFIKMLPLFVGTALVLGLAMALTVGFIWGLTVFVGLLTLLFLFQVEGCRVKAKRRIKRLVGELPELEFRFSGRGIAVRTARQKGDIQYPWFMVTRAVERPQCVEFYTDSGFFRIPKREIADLTALKELVDNHLPAEKT